MPHPPFAQLNLAFAFSKFIPTIGISLHNALHYNMLLGLTRARIYPVILFFLLSLLSQRVGNGGTNGAKKTTFSLFLTNKTLVFSASQRPVTAVWQQFGQKCSSEGLQLVVLQGFRKVCDSSDSNLGKNALQRIHNLLFCKGLGRCVTAVTAKSIKLYVYAYACARVRRIYRLFHLVSWGESFCPAQSSEEHQKGAASNRCFDAAPLLSKKAPIFFRKSPLFLRKSPMFSAKCRTFSRKAPLFSAKSRTFDH